MRKALARAKQKSPQLAVGSATWRWCEEQENRAKTMKTVSLSAHFVMMDFKPSTDSDPWTNPFKQLQTTPWQKWKVMPHL
jgi:hypothetical protein